MLRATNALNSHVAAHYLGHLSTQSLQSARGGGESCAYDALRSYVCTASGRGDTVSLTVDDADGHVPGGDSGGGGGGGDAGGGNNALQALYPDVFARYPQLARPGGARGNA